MSTLDKLNDYFKTDEVAPGFKALTPMITCADGTTLSVQASEFHYSTPKGNNGPYTAVEVWCIESSTPITEFDYSEEAPSAYVPIEHVVQFIDNHGGFKD